MFDLYVFLDLCTSLNNNDNDNDSNNDNQQMIRNKDILINKQNYDHDNDNNEPWLTWYSLFSLFLPINSLSTSFHFTYSTQSCWSLIALLHSNNNNNNDNDNNNNNNNNLRKLFY